MHRYKIVTQISLIFSILNPVLAAPVVVQRIHEARGDSSSEDGSTSSGYPAPYLSSDSSVSGYSWLLDRPPRLSPQLPASLHESASPHPSSSGSSEVAIRPFWRLRMWLHMLPPVLRPVRPPPPGWLEDLSSSWSSDITQPPSTGSGRAETYSPPDQFTPSHPPSSLSSADSFSGMNPWVSDESMPTPYSSASGGSLPASDGSVPSHDLISGVRTHDSISGESVSSHHPSSLSSSISTPYSSASGGSPASSGYLSAAPLSHDSISGLVPYLTPDGSPLSPSSPTETPPDNAEFFNKNMMKKLKIAAGVIIVGGTIATIVSSQIKHNKHRDSQDS